VIPLATLPEQDAGPRGAWREELLTRLGWILFLVGTPLVLYLSRALDLDLPLSAAAVLVPVSGGLTAAFAGRVGLQLRASLLVAALLVAGATLAHFGGPSPGSLLSLVLASVVAALVFGGRAGLLALAAGAAGLLVLGSAGRMASAAVWAAQLPLLSTWVRMAIVFSLLTGLVVLLVSTAVRRAEANAEELRLAEARARASEERWRRISEASHEGIGFSEGGRIVDSNQQLADMLGYTRDELIGMPVVGLISPEHRDRVLGVLVRNAPAAYEHLAVRKDGTTFPVEVRGRSLGQDRRAGRQRKSAGPGGAQRLRGTLPAALRRQPAAHAPGPTGWFMSPSAAALSSPASRV